MRPTRLSIDLDALRHNFRQAKALAHGQSVLCVVKANAYGHGLVPVSRVLAAEGGAWLGVATVAEGVVLRQAGIDLPILLMGGFLGGDEADDMVRHRLTPAIFTDEQIGPLAKAANDAGKPLAVHVKIDTGMGRIGYGSEAAADAIGRIAATPGLQVEGVFTHFAEADLADSPAALEQLELMVSLYRALGDLARHIPLWHVANSAALMRRLGVEGMPTGLFRPGIMLYGERPGSGFLPPVPLQPVARWSARLIQVKTVPAGTAISYGRTFVTTRTSRIATLPVGYADGFRRALSNNGSVLIRGRHAPIVGRVCMDMAMVDVTDLDGVSVGETAVLLGRDGDNEISATDIGSACDTIAYDILCGISERVPRHYLGRSG